MRTRVWWTVFVLVLYMALASARSALAQSGPAGPAFCAVYAGTAANSAEILWNPVPGASTYQLYRWSASSGWVLLSSALTSSSAAGNIEPAYADSGLTKGTTYWYGLYSIDATGNRGAFGTEVSFVDGAARLAAPSITIGSSYQGVYLNWPAVSGATSYVILKCLYGSSDWQMLASGVTGTSYTDANVVSGLEYDYVMAAANANGVGLWPAAKTVTIPAAPPNPPTNLTATPGNGNVQLNWTAAPGAAYYSVTVQTVPSNGTYNTYQTGATGYTASGLTNGTTYSFSVASVSGSGLEGYSTSVTATPQGAIAAPTVTLTPVGVPGYAAVSLSWTAVPTATSYNIYEGTSPGGESATPIATGITGTTDTISGTSWVAPSTVSNLVVGTHYYFFVRAVAGSQLGLSSNEVSNIAALTPVTTNNWAAPFQPATNVLLYSDDGPRTIYCTQGQWTVGGIVYLNQSVVETPILKWDMFCGLPYYCTAEVLTLSNTGSVLSTQVYGGPGSLANNWYGLAAWEGLLEQGGAMELLVSATGVNVPVTIDTCELRN